MDTFNVQNNLYWYLLRTAIRGKHDLMKIADKHGLSVMQLYTLCLLENDKSIPMNALAATLHCDASNLTGIVDRLFTGEYIKREENPKDRRVKMITLTPKGARMVSEIFAELPATQPAGLNSLSDEQKEQLTALLALTFEPASAAAVS
jgi:DNA-binding MarR family transcriptional regulator